MQNQTTPTGEQAMPVVDLSLLSDAELSRQLTDCRITLESIYPYKCKDVSEQQRALRAEWQRRKDSYPGDSTNAGDVVQVIGGKWDGCVLTVLGARNALGEICLEHSEGSLRLRDRVRLLRHKLS